MIASVVVAADDPFTEMDICVSMRRPGRRRLRARHPRRRPEPEHRGERLHLIRRCANVFHGAQNACYRWLGTALNVVTNGDFEGDGCGELVRRDREACKDGAPGTRGRWRRSPDVT